MTWALQVVSWDDAGTVINEESTCCEEKDGKWPEGTARARLSLTCELQEGNRPSEPEEPLLGVMGDESRRHWGICV